MKCPCCELVIEDERQQVRHTERCHPELLMERWEKAQMDPDDIAALLGEIAVKHPDLLSLIDECTSMDCAVNLTVVSASYTKVTLIPRDRMSIDAEGPTVMAALCLAMDRMQYAASQFP